MRLVLLVLGLFFAFTAADSFFPSDAEAAYNAKGKCKRLLNRMYGKPGYGAFAVSRNGRACGLATGYAGPKAAASAARRQCRKLTRGCRVVRTKKGKRRLAAKDLPRLRSNCRKSYNTWRKRRDGYSAFALAKDGTYCNAVWNAGDAKQAADSALKGCKAKVGCTIYAANGPKDLDSVRQQQLADLGFYKGKIDGIWGRGTRRAMKKFVTQAGHNKQDDEKAWALLKWATQIKRGYEVDNDKAIELAQQAYVKGNTLFVAALAKPRNGTSQSQNTAVASANLTRNLNVVRRMGLVPADKFAAGKGVWTFDQSEANDPLAAQQARCRLVTGGLVFAHYADPTVGTVAIFDQPALRPDVKTAQWFFDDHSKMSMKVGRKADIGAYLSVPKPNVFFELISDDKLLSVRTAEMSVGFDVTKIKPMADRFVDCLKKVVPETPQTQPTTASVEITSSGTDNVATATAKRDRKGQFVFMTELDALPVRMLFDTGASYVSINETTARKIGIIVKPGDFKFIANTANGQTKFAKAKVKEMRVGNVVLNDVEVAVLRDEALVSGALLGMSFVKRLKRFEFEGEQIKLTQ